MATRMQQAVRLAFARPVVRRALKSAIVVGSVLIAINHGDGLMGGDLTAGRLVRMVLTALVPYVVSTLSSIEAMRDSRPTAVAAESGASTAGT